MNNSKQEKNKFYLEARKIVNEVDPIHLLDVVPDDEYDFEVNTILENIKDFSCIYNIFVNAFDEKLAGDKSKYLYIARKLKEAEINK